MVIARPILSALVVALLAACSGDSTAAELIDPAPEATAEPTVAEAQPPVPTPTPQPVPASEPDGSAAVQAWLELWDGAEKLVTDPEAAADQMLAVASVEVVNQLDTIYNPASASGATSSARRFENTPVLEAQADGSIAIDGCIFEAPKAGNATIWYSGSAELTDDGVWNITSITLTSHIGCVPSDVAADAIAGYEAYWDARVEFWDPAQPTSPLLGQTMTGAHLDLVSGLLADHADRGLALRGRPRTHPEIIEVRSATEVVVLDCVEQDPGRGVFVLETGERLDDIPVVRDGQRDLTSAVMVLEDGAWKVSDVQGQADVSCDTAPTPQGLPVV